MRYATISLVFLTMAGCSGGGFDVARGAGDAGGAEGASFEPMAADREVTAEPQGDAGGGPAWVPCVDVGLFMLGGNETACGLACDTFGSACGTGCAGGNVAVFPNKEACQAFEGAVLLSPTCDEELPLGPLTQNFPEITLGDLQARCCCE